MNAIELDKQYSALLAPLSRLESEREAILARIAPELELNRQARDEAQAELSSAVIELLNSVELHQWNDALTYQVLSDMLWNRGLGVDSQEEENYFKRLFQGTYTMATTSFYGPYERAILGFTVAVPRESAPSVLERTAQVLSPLLKAASACSDEARLHVMEDSCGLYESFNIVWDEEEQMFELSGSRGFQHEELLELLKRVPTYC